MTWNHRVFAERLPEGDLWLTIREAFYDQPTDEIPHGWTSDAVEVAGDSIEDLRETLEQMLRALDKPVLEEENGKIKR